MQQPFRLDNISFPITLVFVFLALTTLAGLGKQQKRSSQKEFNEEQFPVVEEQSLKTKSNQERVKSEIKAKRFSMGTPAVSLPHWGVAAGVQSWPANFSALPVAESTTILLGDVTEATANLSDDRMAVFSDFTIKPIAVLKDTCNATKDSPLVTASRYGGRVKFQDGHTLLVFNSGLGMPQVGRRYLFFLKQTDADADLLTAYEISQGVAIPLDSGTPNFDTYKGVKEEALISEVQEKIKNLSKITLN